MKWWWRGSVFFNDIYISVFSSNVCIFMQLDLHTVPESTKVFCKSRETAWLRKCHSNVGYVIQEFITPANLLCLRGKVLLNESHDVKVIWCFHDERLTFLHACSALIAVKDPVNPSYIVAGKVCFILHIALKVHM